MMRALEIVIRHERSLELKRLRLWNHWLELESRLNFLRRCSLKHRYQLLRDSIFPNSMNDHVWIWKDEDGVYIYHAEGGITGLL
jgi:hypothetical protein